MSVLIGTITGSLDVELRARTCAVSRHFVHDVVRVMKCIGPNINLFKTLKEVRLNFANTKYLQQGTPNEEERSIAIFLSACVNLVNLQLWTRDPDKAYTASFAIAEVISHLLKLK